METREMVNLISTALYSLSECEKKDIIEDISTYREKGVLTNDVGIVVSLSSNEVFYVTVKKQ